MDQEGQPGILIVDASVSLETLQSLADTGFGDLVKAVVDVDRRIMALGGELHADEEALLLDLGSHQRNLWGINLYPQEYGSGEFLEFDSMINLRPADGNRSRSVDNPTIRETIVAVVDQLLRPDG